MAKAADKLALVTSVPERPDVNFKFDGLTLVDENDKALDWNLLDSRISASVNLTMTGASTVDIQFEDADYDFLNDPILANWAFTIKDVSLSSARNFSTHRITAATSNINAGDQSDFEWVLGGNPVDMFLDTIAFRLCHVQTQQNLLTLESEDRVASKLRAHKGFKSATRGLITRAGFIASLCKEAGVDYWIPEVNVVQPVAVDTQAQTAPDLRSSGGAGISVADGLTCKGKPLTQRQVDIVNNGLQAATSLRAPFKAQVAYIEALITENTISNPNPGSEGDEGSLSITSSTAHGLSFSPFDVAASASWFFSHGFAGNGGAISIAQTNPRLAAYQIAQAVQGSGAGAASDGAANYGLYETEATAIVQAAGGSVGSGIPSSHPATYTFTRGPNEDSWDCIQRLASEVGWYGFVRENRLWFVSGNYLYNSPAQLELVRGERGVDYVDVDLDMGARDQISEVVVNARSDLWTALPGMTVHISKAGPANGKWSVASVQIDLLDEANGATVTLQKPLPARPEPASTVGSAAATAFGGAAGTVQAAYQAAQALSNMGLPYLWGGGHSPGGLGNVHAGGPGLDCSGSVSWVLSQAGMFTGDAAWTSGALAKSWGVPGQGGQMTVWANGVHTFIEFNLTGLHMQLNTVSPGDVGPRLYKWGPPGGNTAGFTPRHWPNT